MAEATEGEHMTLLDYHIERGGGVIAGPQGLGILVGEDPKQCPCGWLFVDTKNPPAQEDREAILKALRSGRGGWPEREAKP